MSSTVLQSIVIAIGLLAVGTVVYIAAANHSTSSTFKSVTAGMTKAEVISLMGAPGAENAKCQNHPMWLDKPINDHACVSELQYDARMSPEFWTIGFDAQGHAIAKYHFVSP